MLLSIWSLVSGQGSFRLLSRYMLSGWSLTLTLFGAEQAAGHTAGVVSISVRGWFEAFSYPSVKT